MARPSYHINRRALMAELSAAEPILKREADRVIRQYYFDPAVAQMKNDFETHLVTQEIAGGVHGTNITDTLEGDFKNTKRSGDDDSPPNLYSFIGFKAGSDPLLPIRNRLDPSHQSGPKLVYRGKDRNRLSFRYEIKAPSEQVIYNETPMPWGEGDISWAKRIEQGIPGIMQYLNVYGRKKSRSGGGIQVEAKLPGRVRFRPVQYLSGIFKDFVRRASGGR